MVEIDDQQPNIMIDKNIDSGVFVPDISDCIDIVIVNNAFLEKLCKQKWLFISEDAD